MKSLLLIILCSTFLAAQSDSLIVVKKSDLPTTLVKKLEVEQNLINAGKWAGMGKEIGVAVREGLGALNDETNKFANTRVGIFVMFIIAFKVLGYPIIQLLIGLSLLIIGTIVFIFFFFKSCVHRKILLKETIEDKKKIKEFGEYKPKEIYYAALTGACYLVYLITCMAIIFIH